MAALNCGQQLKNLFFFYVFWSFEINIFFFVVERTQLFLAISTFHLLFSAYFFPNSVIFSQSYNCFYSIKKKSEKKKFLLVEFFEKKKIWKKIRLFFLFKLKYCYLVYCHWLWIFQFCLIWGIKKRRNKDKKTKTINNK